jgi:hypothetical protein
MASTIGKILSTTKAGVLQVLIKENNKFSNFFKAFILPLLLIIVLVIAINYVVAGIEFYLFSMMATDFEHATSYLFFVTSSVAFILLTCDIVLYAYSLNVFVLDKWVRVQRFWCFIKHLITASTPILLIVIPPLLCGVVTFISREPLIMRFSSWVLIVFLFILTLYTLFAQPVYAPYAGLAIIICVNREEKLCVFRAMCRMSDLILNIIATAIAVFLVTLLVSRMLTYMFPAMNNPLLPVPSVEEVPLTWRSRVYQALSRSIVRYGSLVLGPVNYIIFAYIFKWLSREKLKQLISL